MRKSDGSGLHDGRIADREPVLTRRVRRDAVDSGRLIDRDGAQRGDISAFVREDE